LREIKMTEKPVTRLTLEEVKEEFRKAFTGLEDPDQIRKKFWEINARLSPEDRRKEVEKTSAELAAKGLLYDTGRRKDGKVVWAATPGKEAEWEEELQDLSDNCFRVVANDNEAWVADFAQLGEAQQKYDSLLAGGHYVRVRLVHRIDGKSHVLRDSCLEGRQR
jgi:hypothetical protein